MDVAKHAGVSKSTVSLVLQELPAVFFGCAWATSIEVAKAGV